MVTGTVSQCTKLSLAICMPFSHSCLCATMCYIKKDKQNIFSVLSNNFFKMVLSTRVLVLSSLLEKIVVTSHYVIIHFFHHGAINF